ncbi:hypothetical protein [Paenibacillus thermotolerans]|uniref:hypothetical protein n=1 Tax=Paenibacillus thermotolerans TaxID=3027807 RepID=UPI0030823340
MLTNLLCFPMIFTSESFYNMQDAPAWAQTVGKALPYSPFVDAVRAAMNGSFDVLPQLLLTIVIFAAVRHSSCRRYFSLGAGTQLNSEIIVNTLDESCQSM